jgi:hypothetical protein
MSRCFFFFFRQCVKSLNNKEAAPDYGHCSWQLVRSFQCGETLEDKRCKICVSSWSRVSELCLSLSLSLAGWLAVVVFVCFVLFCFSQCFFFLVAVGAMPEGRCFCRRRTKDKRESSETCQSTTSSTDAPFLPTSLSASLAPLQQPYPHHQCYFLGSNLWGRWGWRSFTRGFSQIWLQVREKSKKV